MTWSEHVIESQGKVSALSETPSLKERQRQERERLILRAAGALFAERGYHATSLEDIAARVGIAKGTIYLHFASKDDLVVAMLRHGLTYYLKALDDALESAPTPREKLLAVIDQFTSSQYNEGFKTFMALMQNPTIVTRMSELRREMRQQWDGPRRRLAAAIDEGKATGDFDPALPTSMIAALLMGLVNPHSQLRLVEEDGMTSEQIAASLKRFFFKGIAAEPRDDPASGTH